MSDDKFVRIKVTEKTRRIIKLLAALKDKTMMETVHDVVTKELEEIQGKK